VLLFWLPPWYSSSLLDCFFCHGIQASDLIVALCMLI
jgi:hypothetical protein